MQQICQRTAAVQDVAQMNLYHIVLIIAEIKFFTIKIVKVRSYKIVQCELIFYENILKSHIIGLSFTVENILNWANFFY